MLDHAHFWPLVSEKCWSEGRWWPIRGSWWWFITNRRCRWNFTLFCDEEESPSTRWSNRLNKGALKAAVSLEEPVDSPRSRSSWKLEDREELQALNSRFEPAEAAHIFSTSYCFSEETIEHVAHRTLCTLLRNWGGFGCSPEEIWDFFAIFVFMCVFNFSSAEDHQPHTGQGRGCCSAGLFILITGATNPLHTRAVAPRHLMLSPEMQLFPCYASQHKTDFLHRGTEAEVNCVSECKDFFFTLLHLKTGQYLLTTTSSVFLRFFFCAMFFFSL